MACTGHTVAGICDGHINSCPTHVGYIPPVVPTVWTSAPLSTSVKIISDHHNELRTAIDDELNRRTQTWPIDPGTVSAVDKALSDHVRQLRDGINSAKAWAWPTYLSDANTGTDDKIEAQQYNAMRDQVNVMELECVCDCNYICTCDCNYLCTCDCNYACTCHCDYACTCNCDYSCVCDCDYGSGSCTTCTK